MSQDERSGSDNRLVRLEREVDQLRKRVSELEDRMAAERSGEPAGEQRVSVQRAERDQARREREFDQDHSTVVGASTSTSPSFSFSDWQGERLLNIVGIGLFLLGVAFLFEYSIDQGWIGPAIRVGVGAAVGCVLLGTGLWIREQRHRLSQVLLGGGVAALYISIFAAYQLYELLGSQAAFVGMVAVTVLAFLLAVRQDEAVLSIIGAAGGFGTPFLLYSESGDTAGLVLYTCMVLAGAAAVLFYQGWRSLLYVATGGAWLVLGFAYGDLTEGMGGRTGSYFSMQAGLAFTWLAIGIAPTVPGLGLVDSAPKPGNAIRRLGWILPVALSAILAVVMTRHLWEIGTGGRALVALVFAGGYIGYGWWLRTGGHRIGALSMITAAAFLLVLFVNDLAAGAYQLLGLGLIAVLLALMARDWEENLLTAMAAALYLIVVGFLGTDLLNIPQNTAQAFTVDALLGLCVILLGWWLAAWSRFRTLRTGYLAVSHLLTLVWLYHHLVVLDGGQAYVTMAWCIYTLGLLGMGVLVDSMLVRRGALATLLGAVAKLFLVDLAELGALWRILLFLILGGILLAASYYLPVLSDRLSRSGISLRQQDEDTSSY